ncbi:MAG: glycosyltransferase family 9 protein [Verrucomicrobiota bacterium]
MPRLSHLRALALRHSARAWGGAWRGGFDLLRWRRRAARETRPLVAIVLLEHLGDIVACEPVIRHLRQASPRAFLVWVCLPAYREVLAGHPDLDAVLTVPCLGAWARLRRWPVLDREVNLHFHGKECPYCRRPIPNPGGDVSITTDTYYLEGRPLLAAFCRAAGLPVLADAPRLAVPASARVRVARLGLPARYVVIHARSNNSERDWRPERWRELAGAIPRLLGVAVVEVGLAPVVPQPAPAGYRSLCGQLSLLETAAVLAQADLFVGIDSGPAHLANALRVPGVLLLGRFRHFEAYLPYTGFYAGVGAEVVRTTGSVADLEVAAVQAAVQRQLAGFASRPPGGTAG